MSEACLHLGRSERSSPAKSICAGAFSWGHRNSTSASLNRSRVNISNTFASGLLPYRLERIVNSHILESLESLVDAVNGLNTNPSDHSPPGPRQSTFVHVCNSRLCQWIRSL